jgi:anti-sigma factor RsiW
MKCHEVIDQFSLYSYGEVSGEAEERIESHLAACAECAQAFAKHRGFFEILNRREEPNESALLTECRMDFRRHLTAQTAAPSHGSWLSRLLNLSQFHIPMRIPAGAMALFALGWFAARYTPAKFLGMEAGLGQPMFSNVQSVQSGAPGKVQIAVDEVQRRVVTGSLDEPRIQQLLLDAVREESNPGVRVESIGILRNSADSEQVRGALIDALSHDPNAGVRLKALEGLKQYAGEPAVRQTLANVLLRDDNPGVRVQAIDLLTAHHDDSIVGVLQDVMQKEDDGYIRTRTRDLLETMKASVGTY